MAKMDSISYTVTCLIILVVTTIIMYYCFFFKNPYDYVPGEHAKAFQLASDTDPLKRKWVAATVDYDPDDVDENYFKTITIDGVEKRKLVPVNPRTGKFSIDDPPHGFLQEWDVLGSVKGYRINGVNGRNILTCPAGRPFANGKCV